MRIRKFFVLVHDLFVFVTAAIWHGTPLWMWPDAWEKLQDEKLQEIRAAVWDLKKQGRIREDAEGRLWIVDK